MNTQINPRRLLGVLAISLLLLGGGALAATGQLPHVVASAGGYARAKVDFLFGKRAFQISKVPSRGRRRLPPTVGLWNVGFETSEEYYFCLSSSPCASYHRAYDAEVRRSIKREFGYDIFAELRTYRAPEISIVIQHR